MYHYHFEIKKYKYRRINFYQWIIFKISINIQNKFKDIQMKKIIFLILKMKKIKQIENKLILTIIIKFNKLIKIKYQKNRKNIN